MPSPIQHILSTYPSIKKEFDLTVEVHPKAREWFAWWVKKVMKRKTKFNKEDVEAYRLAFFKMRQRQFKTTKELYASCHGIVLDAYDTIRRQREKKKDDFKSMGDILKGMMSTPTQEG